MSTQQPQSIPTFVTSPQAATSGPFIPQHQPQQKPRYTKAEKRAYAKQQKATSGAPHTGRRPTQVKRYENPKPLAGDYSNLTVQQIDDQIRLLTELRKLKAAARRPLESRITREEFPGLKKEKKELSAEKLEKIQKRREVRAAKKAEWAAKKAAERAEGQAAASEQKDVLTRQVEQTEPVLANTNIDNDIINWDEL